MSNKDHVVDNRRIRLDDSGWDRLTIAACSFGVRSQNDSTKDDNLDSAVGAISLEAVISVWATLLLVGFQVC